MPFPPHEEADDFADDPIDGGDPMETLFKMLPKMLGEIGKVRLSPLIELHVIGEMRRMPIHNAWPASESGVPFLKFGRQALEMCDKKKRLIPSEEVRDLEEHPEGTLVNYRGDVLLVTESITDIIKKAGIETR